MVPESSRPNPNFCQNKTMKNSHRVVGPLILSVISRVKKYFARTYTSDIDQYLSNSVDQCDLEKRMNTLRYNMKGHGRFYP